jgi:hypothetical protein
MWSYRLYTFTLLHYLCELYVWSGDLFTLIVHYLRELASRDVIIIYVYIYFGFIPIIIDTINIWRKTTWLLACLFSVCC